MTPLEAIRESRVSVAYDDFFEPLVYYCSDLSLEAVRALLVRLGRIEFGEALGKLGDKNTGRAFLVPLDKAEATENWEPLLPSCAIDKLGDIVRTKPHSADLVCTRARPTQLCGLRRALDNPSL